jgi:hypothetical protein
MAKCSTISATIFDGEDQSLCPRQPGAEGKTVIITSGRDKRPVAKIEAIEPVKTRRLGFMETPGFKLPDSFWEPLPEEELALWNGEGETFPEE